ncbi:MAG TPA: glycosyltransferase family 39 protein [Candidatus Dormibacteraeota bacterium]|nr:glycosyltransferase family 39 protein [Candidatus Dormibacteraeota bacterium]
MLWQPLALIAVAALLFAIRLLSPSNFLDQDQERPASYVLDVIKNGHWICQRDFTGDITSKPPLYTWLCALLSLPFGRVTLFSLYLPGAAAACGTALLLWSFGRTYFGTRAAFLAALASMVTSAGLKEFGLARTDAVFAFTVCATALLAFRAWTRGGGWTWFWLLAAAATLTKGPLGVLLAGAGLVAVWWEKKSGNPLPLKGGHALGIALFLALTVGWILLAYREFGPAVSDKLLGKELVGHAMGESHFPGSLFYQPTLYYLGRAAPWSLLCFYGLWRVWKRPSTDLETRRFERFLFCWFVIGLFIFSMASHQRGDLLWPIMPAGALLATAGLGRTSTAHRMYLAGVALAGLMVVGYAWYYFGPHANQPLVVKTQAVKTLAKMAEGMPLEHTDDPVALQVYLNTWTPKISFDKAAELLRGDKRVFVAVSDVKKLDLARREDDPPLYTVAATEDPQWVRVVSNRPKN